MKGCVYTLIRLLHEDASISVPDVEKDVDDILSHLGDDADEAVSDMLKNDPDMLQNTLVDNPQHIEDFLKSSPEASNTLSTALENPEVMDTLSNSPQAIAAMSSHYSNEPDDIPDQLVRQISQAVGDDKDTPKGDILEYYENVLSRHHIDGQPWSGTLQDLASQQGRSFGGADLVDSKKFDKEVRTSVKFSTGTAKSPLKMTEKVLRMTIRNILMETDAR